MGYVIQKISSYHQRIDGMFLDILLYESKYTRISVFYPLGVDYTENIGIMKENSDYFGEIQMGVDVGFTHIALAASDLDESIKFYAKYAKMSVIHERIDKETSVRVIWLSDKTRPFVVVLFENQTPSTILKPLAHLGVGCSSKEEVTMLCEQARIEGVLVREPQDSGYPIGYWALLQDPSGHTLELSYGQEIGLTVKNS